MRIINRVLLLLIVLIYTFQLSIAQDYNNNLKLVYNSPFNIQWTDNNNVVYQIYSKSGKESYSANLSSKAITPCKELEMKRGERPEWVKKEIIVSPDGKKEAFIKDNNVWIRENKIELQLSFDGTSNMSYDNIVWSPDSKKIAATLNQDAPPHRIPLIESSPKNQKQPILQWRDYYKPGDLIPIKKPSLFDAENGKQLSINTKPYENQFDIEFIKWSEDSKAYFFTYNQRGHQVYQIIRVDATDGTTSVSANESFETFVHYYRCYYKFIKNDTQIIWSSELDGWRHLYILDAKTGETLKQLTKGEWIVQEVIEVNEENGYIIFMGNGKNAGEDPYNKHFYKLSLDGKKLTDLTPENANHRITFSPDKKHFFDVYSRPDLASSSVIRSVKDGKLVIDLGKSDISSLLEKGWTMPEVFSSKGRDGKTDIWGTIYRPSNFDSSKKYPVVEYIYAGPHDAHVTKDFAPVLRFHKLVESGFIVVCIDGMGTANRSKAFHDVCWRNLKDAGFPDRKLWIKAASEKYPYMDISRGVGIYGYSAGGQNAMSALLFHKDFYTVAVSLCGCHDNRMDKIWWNEQWMGYPIGKWYSESSNVDNAHLLEGKLLLINGELDDNVDPTSTLQVVDALIKANKSFEQLYLPGHTHSLGSKYITERIFEFFIRNLRDNHLSEEVETLSYNEKPQITAPPANLKLDPYYKKYMNVNGIHVCSSWRVPDSCFVAAYATLKAMTDMMPKDVMKSLTDHNTRIGIMARYEGTTDIPEHSYLINDTTINWNLRARGLGGTINFPFSTCAEENILAYQIDKYHAEDIMIHEFAHTIHNVGISPIYPEFNNELQTALDSAKAKGLWYNTYTATNIEEYFAEGVQNWFNVNAEVSKPDGKHNRVNTREELKRYDPALYELMARFFPNTPLQISKHKKVNLYNQE